MSYTIGEMSKITGIAASTLRYYDKEGLLPFLKHVQNNVRIFSQEDYEALKVIECLKKTGLSIREIKNFMNLVREGNSTLNGRLEIFRKQREAVKLEMEKLNATLNILDYKCWYYEKANETGNEETVKSLKLNELPEKYREVKKRLCCSQSRPAGKYE